MKKETKKQKLTKEFVEQWIDKLIAKNEGIRKHIRAITRAGEDDGVKIECLDYGDLSHNRLLFYRCIDKVAEILGVEVKKNPKWHMSGGVWSGMKSIEYEGFVFDEVYTPTEEELEACENESEE